MEIKGKSKIHCDLKRHLSPRTVGMILRSLPLQSNAYFLGKHIVYMETPIDSGIERPKKEFKKGDIAFLPSNGSICFFLSDLESNKTMSPIGKIHGDVDLLKDAKPGDVFVLQSDG